MMYDLKNCIFDMWRFLFCVKEICFIFAFNTKKQTPVNQISMDNFCKLKTNVKMLISVLVIRLYQDFKLFKQWKIKMKSTD